MWFHHILRVSWQFCPVGTTNYRVWREINHVGGELTDLIHCGQLRSPAHLMSFNEVSKYWLPQGTQVFSKAEPRGAGEDGKNLTITRSRVSGPTSVHNLDLRTQLVSAYTWNTVNLHKPVYSILLCLTATSVHHSNTHMRPFWVFVRAVLL